MDGGYGARFNRPIISISIFLDILTEKRVTALLRASLSLPLPSYLGESMQ